MDKKFNNCPFCGNENIKVKEYNRAPSGQDYDTGDYFLYAECDKCFCRTGNIYYKTLSRFTPYSVQDFNDNKILRSKEEERYAEYIELVKDEIRKTWNTRS